VTAGIRFAANGGARPKRKYTLVGALEDEDAILAEWRLVYKDMRAGRIETFEGTRLIYALDVGARMARALAELKELRQLREAMEQVQSQGAVTFLPAPAADAPVDSTMNPMIEAAIVDASGSGDT
jgi:hypothetical protein